jgi:K+-transporting ATPase KdpF subunit
VRSADEVGDAMILDSVIGLIVSVAMLVYLVIAMLKPEKF